MLLGGRAFDNPELLIRMQFPIRIKLHRGFYLKNKQVGSFVKDGKKLKTETEKMGAAGID